MNWELFVAFLVITSVLVVTPGPIVTLVIATGAREGMRAALTTVVGTTLDKPALAAAAKAARAIMSPASDTRGPAEYRIAAGGQKLAGLVVVISDIDALGLTTANGLIFTTAFYWDRDDASRVWSKRFFDRTGRMPGMVQAGTYSAVLHYLKAMEAAGTADGRVVADKIRELPVDDFFAKGRVREDGRMMHDMYLVEVKTPSESKTKWDYYKLLRSIPAEEAAQPLSESKCPLVKK